MTDKQTPPDWVLIEAAKRGGLEQLDIMSLWSNYYHFQTFRAICDMIERYEQPPVDRKLLCAREAYKGLGFLPDGDAVKGAVRAIELWEEGFGK